MMGGVRKWVCVSSRPWDIQAGLQTRTGSAQTHTGLLANAPAPPPDRNTTRNSSSTLESAVQVAGQCWRARSGGDLRVGALDTQQLANAAATRSLHPPNPPRTLLVRSLRRPGLFHAHLRRATPSQDGSIEITLTRPRIRKRAARTAQHKGGPRMTTPRAGQSILSLANPHRRPPPPRRPGTMSRK